MKYTKLLLLDENDCEAIKTTIKILELISSTRCWSLEEMKEIYEKVKEQNKCYKDGNLEVYFRPSEGE